MGSHAISQHIMGAHPEYKLSHMAIVRGLEIADRNKVEEQIQEGLNPVDEFQREFKMQIDGNTEKLESLEKKANKILDEAMESNSIADKTKALKEVRETLAQVVKNYTALQQFCGRQMDGINRKAFEQKEQVNVLLMSWTRIIEEKLCPRCKQEITPEVIKLIEQKEET